jgi:uncharacterized protein
MALTPAAVQRAFDPGFLNLILFATEQCNFRCTYCYEDFEKGRMGEEVVEGVRRLIARRAEEDLHTLALSWFGGEPLLAKDLVIELTSFAAARLRAAGGRFSANATTNGYHLDVATARRLTEAGVTRFHISLDGPARCHDRTRVKATGAGTFDRIWRNLRALRESDLAFDVLLRIHATPANQDDLPGFVGELNRAFSGDSRFGAYFKRVGRLGGPNDGHMAVLGHGAARNLTAELTAALAPDLRSTPSAEPHVCYASAANSMTIRADGVIGKCTVALQDERNHLGRIRPDGTVGVDQSKLRLWLRGFESLDEGELACPMHGLPEAIAR